MRFVLQTQGNMMPAQRFCTSQDSRSAWAGRWVACKCVNPFFKKKKTTQHMFKQFTSHVRPKEELPDHWRVSGGARCPICGALGFAGGVLTMLACSLSNVTWPASPCMPTGRRKASSACTCGEEERGAVPSMTPEPARVKHPCFSSLSPCSWAG